MVAGLWDTEGWLGIPIDPPPEEPQEDHPEEPQLDPPEDHPPLATQIPHESEYPELHETTQAG